jgi:two-component system, cell cycle sensor histidine kinase and response regulator CckA
MSEKGSMPTILLIEDDEAVRRVLRCMLLGQGHRVIEAGSAPEAIRAAAASPDPIDLVIADVVMPRSNCDALVAELRDARPNLQSVLISGYSEDILMQHGVDARRHPNFLQKPFSAGQLRTKIHEALGTETMRTHA